ncbi:hypothetical protein [Pseudomonas sp. MH9.2]|uniref:hypothetical protein n=1 Tax=Pseudomonas sp. MH9.2 TaxID=3048629 RepID=UPI0039FD6765
MPADRFGQASTQRWSAPLAATGRSGETQRVIALAVGFMEQQLSEDMLAGKYLFSALESRRLC